MSKRKLLLYLSFPCMPCHKLLMGAGLVKLQINSYINPLIKLVTPYILHLKFFLNVVSHSLLKWGLFQASGSVHTLDVVCVCVWLLWRPIWDLHLPWGQLHSAQRDPPLWCEWKEPCCCWLMLFLATSPFHCRLYCWGTAGGLPGCLSETSLPPSPPHPSHHLRLTTAPTYCSAVLQEVR